MLEKGAFDKRTADFLWMMIFGAISLLVSSSSFCIQNFRLDQTKRHSWTSTKLAYNSHCLNQVVSVIPVFNTYALGIPMVSMLVYVWSRENPNAQINIYGLFQLRVCNFTTIDCISHFRVARSVNRQSKPYGPVDNMINSLVVDILPFFCRRFIFHGLCSYWMWYLGHH